MALSDVYKWNTKQILLKKLKGKHNLVTKFDQFIQYCNIRKLFIKKYKTFFKKILRKT